MTSRRPALITFGLAALVSAAACRKEAQEDHASVGLNIVITPKIEDDVETTTIAWVERGAVVMYLKGPNLPGAACNTSWYDLGMGTVVGKGGNFSLPDPEHADTQAFISPYMVNSRGNHPILIHRLQDGYSGISSYAPEVITASQQEILNAEVIK